MPEVPTTYTLERLYHRVAELEADLRVISNTIEVLERVVLDERPPNKRGEYHDNRNEIAQEVEADLFAEYLQHPEEDQ
jgi:hypothetical protein